MQKAFAFYQQLLDTPGLRPNVVVMTSLLGACDGDPDSTFRVVQEMKDHGIVPDDVLLQRISVALSRAHHSKKPQYEQTLKQVAGPSRARSILS